MALLDKRSGFFLFEYIVLLKLLSKKTRAIDTLIGKIKNTNLGGNLLFHASFVKVRIHQLHRPVMNMWNNMHENTIYA